MKKDLLKISAVFMILGIVMAPPAAGDAWAFQEAGDSAIASTHLVQARDAASRDDHMKAIRLYLKAIYSDSTLKSDVAVELGHQYTWADMPDSAIPWYELYLKAHPGDLEASLGLARALSWADRLEESEKMYRGLLERREDQNQVRLGLARVVSWRDRLPEAEKIYRTILRDDPDNHEALLGLAQVKNWSGRHREALKLYSGLIEKDPGNGDAVRGAANAEHWMGLPFKALERLKRSSGDKETLKIRREIEESLSPQSKLDFASTRDSDDIRIRRLSAALEFHSKQFILFSGSYAIERILQSGYPDIKRNSAGITLARRFNPAFAVTISPGYERNRFKYYDLAVDSSLHTALDLFVVDAYATITPIDWFRMDAGYSRNSLEIPLSIFRGVIVSGVNIGADNRFTHSVIMYSTARFKNYSDSNRRISLSQRLKWQSPWGFPLGFKNRLAFTPGYEYFHFSKVLANGYYNPRDYLSMFLGTSWSGEVTKWLGFSMNGRLSVEREDNKENSLIGAVEGSLSMRPFDRVSVVAGYHNSRSRLASPTGYTYTGFYVNVAGRF